MCQWTHFPLTSPTLPEGKKSCSAELVGIIYMPTLLEWMHALEKNGGKDSLLWTRVMDILWKTDPIYLTCSKQINMINATIAYDFFR